MALQFHPLTVSSIQRITPQAVAISFAIPQEHRSEFAYKAGQYLTLRLQIDGVEYRRNYSLCSSPARQEPLAIGVKAVDGGTVSQWLNAKLEVGATVDAYPPQGSFTIETADGRAQHYVLLAGGSGITPILSILKTVLIEEPRSVVTLIYANRDAGSVMFQEELQQLSKQYGERMRYVSVLEYTEEQHDSSYTGRMTPEVLRTVLAATVPTMDTVDAFVCGPSGMMESALMVLRERGLPESRMHREYFSITTTADSLQHEPMSSEDQHSNTSDTLVPRRVRIRLYGDEHEFDVQPEETILSAAQRANLDPPYACQIGACCTCRAKVLSGKVRMDEREALSDDEIAEGYALTCQSHPLTDDVFADYDQ